MAKNQNYTLGRGKVYFSRFIAAIQTPEGFEYIGNTPELSFTIESENLDHFSSDAGVREKDASQVSLKMYLVTTAAFVLWTAYGLIEGSWPIMVANLVMLGLAGTILALKLRYP